MPGPRLSADAKTAFDADPKKYTPSLGGWYAFGMSVKDKFPVNPGNFKIVDGKLTLFLKNRDVGAMKLWNDGHENDFVPKAKTITQHSRDCVP